VIFLITEELKINRFILAGHSMGGKVAVNFAMKWPEKINSLIIIDISPFRSVDAEGKFYMEHKQILESILSTDLSEAVSRTDVEAVLAGKIESEKTRGFILKNLQRTDEKTFTWKMNVRSLYDNLERIVDGIPRPTRDTEAVTGFPVIFIRGENSDYLPEDELIAIKRLFPAVEIVTVKNAGHWVHSERPDAIIDIIKKQLIR
jgi:esterase